MEQWLRWEINMNNYIIQCLKLIDKQSWCYSLCDLSFSPLIYNLIIKIDIPWFEANKIATKNNKKTWTEILFFLY